MRVRVSRVDKTQLSGVKARLNAGFHPGVSSSVASSEGCAGTICPRRPANVNHYLAYLGVIGTGVCSLSLHREKVRAIVLPPFLLPFSPSFTHTLSASFSHSLSLIVSLPLSLSFFHTHTLIFPTYVYDVFLGCSSLRQLAEGKVVRAAQDTRSRASTQISTEVREVTRFCCCDDDDATTRTRS